MHAILNFAEFIIQAVLTLMVWVIVAYAILSWLISFNVVNLRNRAVYQISHGLESVARPILRPAQRLLPSFGGMDFSPIIVLLVIQGVKIYLIPPLFAWLHAVVGGPVVV